MLSLGLHPDVASRLTRVIWFIFAYQAAFAAYSVPSQTEKIYDLAGSTGFITSTVLSLYYPTVGTLFSSSPTSSSFAVSAFHPRQLLASAILLIWAARLGYHLVGRIFKYGSDSRFDEAKTQPGLFSALWFGQALWITAVGLPVFLVNSVPASAHPPLARGDYLGLAVWANGLALEVLSDREKSRWRRAKEEKKHEEKFISSGLWSLSRHPNYLGEIILQKGPAILALSCPLSTSTRYLGFISPIFSYLLLRYVSGVPPLEWAAEGKWSDDEDWKTYRDATSLFIPWPFGLGKGKI